MSRTVVEVQRGRVDASTPRTVYVVYDDGHVIAYGPELDGPRPDLWIASLWRGHPLDDEDAVHVDHLATDATWDVLCRNVRDWEDGA